MHLDLTSASRAVLSTRICVVGGGPVGLTLAHALADVGVEVVLVESGGGGPDGLAQALNEGDMQGDPYLGPAGTRARGVGGTAGIWNTVHRGTSMAKYLPLDDADLKAPASSVGDGWPFGMEELAPWYARAQAVCGLGPLEYGGAAWKDEALPQLPFTTGALETRVYQFGPAARFTTDLPDALAASTRAGLLRGATVTDFILDARGERVQELVWRSLGGETGRVRAETFVLATGALENARLLLLLRRQCGPEVGGDWVGRGFMEHPVDHSLELHTRHEALVRGPGFYRCHDTPAGVPVMGRIAPGADLLQGGDRINASVRLLHDDTPRVLTEGASRAVARRLVPGVAVRRAVGGLVRAAARIPGRFRAARYQLLVDLEQRPHPDNRVVLSSRTDGLGSPRLALHWRWRSDDERRRQRTLDRLVQALDEAGVGRVSRRQGRLDPDAHHHAGTTRMHDDPALGVVDSRLRVHGTANLYVAGSSVFPSSGFANPTLTAVALALRLADHLGPEGGT